MTATQTHHRWPFQVTYKNNYNVYENDKGLISKQNSEADTITPRSQQSSPFTKVQEYAITKQIHKTTYTIKQK